MDAYAERRSMRTRSGATPPLDDFALVWTDKEKKEVPLLAKAIAGAAGAGASLGHVALSGRISCT